MARINPDTGRPYGQATTRQFVRMVLTYIADKIIQRGFYLMYWLTALALIAWAVVATYYAAVRICQAM